MLCLEPYRVSQRLHFIVGLVLIIVLIKARVCPGGPIFHLEMVQESLSLALIDW